MHCWVRMLKAELPERYRLSASSATAPRTSRTSRTLTVINASAVKIMQLTMITQFDVTSNTDVLMTGISKARGCAAALGVG